VDEGAVVCGAGELLGGADVSEGSDGNSFGLEINGSTPVAFVVGAAVVGICAFAPGVCGAGVEGAVVPGFVDESACAEAISFGRTVDDAGGLLTVCGGFSSRAGLGCVAGALLGFEVSAVDSFGFDAGGSLAGALVSGPKIGLLAVCAGFSSSGGRGCITGVVLALEVSEVDSLGFEDEDSLAPVLGTAGGAGLLAVCPGLLSRAGSG
jgi:hypothetical protein